MNYKINIYQISINEESDLEKQKIFTEGLLGVLPNEDRFRKFYNKVLSFSLNSNFFENELEVCEECFRLLNDWEGINILDLKDVNVLSPFRSLSVGDIVEINNQLYIVRIIGFLKLSF